MAPRSVRPEVDPEGLARLPGLGPTSARMLVEAEVGDVAALHRLGVVEAWRRLRFRHGARVTVNFIYALEAAIRGIDWRDIEDARKAELKAAAMAIKLELDART